MALGFDPIWFGIFMVIMVECALITPPVGQNLYVIQSVARGDALPAAYAGVGGGGALSLA